MKDDKKQYASDAQLVLARLYRGASIIGLAFMAVTFALYVSGLLHANVPAKEVSSYWHLDAEKFAAETDTPVGWASEICDRPY